MEQYARREDGMQAAQQARGIDVTTVLDMWRRRKWLAIFIFAVVVTAVTSVVMFWTLAFFAALRWLT
jgi:uncharacterized protein involved in exopolysaccharide biosynthesis